MKTLLQTKWMSALLLVVSFALIYNPWIKFPYTFCVIIAFILLATFLQDGNLKALNFKTIGVRQIGIIAACYLLLEFSMDFIVDPIINFSNQSLRMRSKMIGSPPLPQESLLAAR